MKPNNSTFETQSINVKDPVSESSSGTATTLQQINQENKIFFENENQKIVTELKILKNLINDKINGFFDGLNYQKKILANINNGVSYPTHNNFELSESYKNFDVIEFKIYTASSDDLLYYFQVAVNDTDLGVDAPGIILLMDGITRNAVYYKYDFISETEVKWSQVGLNSPTNGDSNRTVQINGIKFAKIIDYSKYITLLKSFSFDLSGIHKPDLGSDLPIDITDKVVDQTDVVLITNPMSESISGTATTQQNLNTDVTNRIENSIVNKIVNNAAILKHIDEVFASFTKDSETSYKRETLFEGTIDIAPIDINFTSAIKNNNYLELKVWVNDGGANINEYIWQIPTNDQATTNYNFLMVNSDGSTASVLAVIDFTNPATLKATLSLSGLLVGDTLVRNIRIVGITYK